MYELVDTTDAAELVGEYDTLTEAREARELRESENLEKYYTIYKVIRTAVE
jgi:hypothetical protein